MIGTVIILCIVVLWVMNLAGQAAATSNFKREAKEDWLKKDAESQQLLRNIANQTDTYYNASAKCRNQWFYGDGSLKRDPVTGRTYEKGQYRATSNGYDCNMQKAGPDARRAPQH